MIKVGMSTVTSATKTTTSAATTGVTPTPGGARTVLATPLQAMINNAIAASMTAMSSSIERMVQEAVSKATTPGPGATPSSISGAGGGLSLPRVTGLTSTSTGTHPALPRVGELPGSAALSSVPLFTSGNTGSISSPGWPPSSSSTTPIVTLSLSLATPSLSLAPLTSKAAPPTDAILVGAASPPVPAKIAQRIWELPEELLPARLGAEPSFMEALSNTIKNKPTKRIECIEQWVCCFNTYTAVMAMKHPDRVGDLLAYSSLIVNASRSYEGTPWLEYDNHFRRLRTASGPGLGPLAQIDSSIWTLHFNGTTAKKVCADCFEPGHRSCKKEDPAMRPRQSARFRAQPYTKPPPKSESSDNTDICWLFNGSAGCNFEKSTGKRCRFRHVCARCKAPGHPVGHCPKSAFSPNKSD